MIKASRAVIKGSTGNHLNSSIFEDNLPKHFKLPDSPKNASYRVMTYQIPVPLGDCSAHLLIDHDVDGKGDVIAAFLMDGGVSKGAAKDGFGETMTAAYRIRQALDFIDKQHGDQWKFHSWVVTHWDADHFHGVVDFFYENGLNPCRRNSNNTYFHAERALFCGGSPLGITMRELDQDGKSMVATDVKLIIGEMGFKIYANLSMEKLIGLDLFALEYLFDPVKGVALFNFKGRNRPCFCVVAANGFGIGKEGPCKNNPSANETSILSILFWPDRKRCSYYTGGDGFPAVEREWVVPFMKEHDLLKDSVTVLKLDHHGSSGELLGTSSDRITEALVTSMRPHRVIVTPGSEYGHPSWDVIAFLYGHYRKIGLEQNDCLYTTRSPYWAQKMYPSGLDLNLKKIKKIWAVLDAWKDKSTPVVIQSWDAWKARFKDSDLRKSDNDLSDPWYRPDQDIRNAAIDVELFDMIGEAAEETLFQEFQEKAVKAANQGKPKKPILNTEELHTTADWRKMFAQWKKSAQADYRTRLRSELSTHSPTPKLARTKLVTVQHIEDLLTRQEARISWADTMRLLWNDLSPQNVNPDPHQRQWYLLCLTSRALETSDGKIEYFAPDGDKAEVFQTALSHAETRSITLKMGYGKNDFPEQQLPETEEKGFKTYIKLRNEAFELQDELEKADEILSDPKATDKVKKAARAAFFKDEERLEEVKKKLKWE